MRIKSEVSHARLDEQSRHNKAKKIIATLEATIGDLSKLKVLDIGTGSGYIAHDLSNSFGEVQSVDLFDERVERKGYDFTKVNNEKLPFMNETFDVVITNHVIEHVPNQTLHINEIGRVLKENGIVYLATPNKYWLTDPHHKLPFISWLPQQWAIYYLKIIKNKEWDIYPLSYKGILRLTEEKFEDEYITIDIIKNPTKYNLDLKSPLLKVTKLVPDFALQRMRFLMPTHILLLKKQR